MAKKDAVLTLRVSAKDKEEIKKENKDLRRTGIALKENNEKLRDAEHNLSLIHI